MYASAGQPFVHEMIPFDLISHYSSAHECQSFNKGMMH